MDFISPIVDYFDVPKGWLKRSISSEHDVLSLSLYNFDEGFQMQW